MIETWLVNSRTEFQAAKLLGLSFVFLKPASCFRFYELGNNSEDAGGKRQGGMGVLEKIPHEKIPHEITNYLRNAVLLLKLIGSFPPIRRYIS